MMRKKIRKRSTEKIGIEKFWKKTNNKKICRKLVLDMLKRINKNSTMSGVSYFKQ